MQTGIIDKTNIEYRTVGMNDSRWYHHRICHVFVEKAKNTVGTDYKNPFALLSISEMASWPSVSILGHCKWTETKDNKFRYD